MKTDKIDTRDCFRTRKAAAAAAALIGDCPTLPCPGLPWREWMIAPDRRVVGTVTSYCRHRSYR